MTTEPIIKVRTLKEINVEGGVVFDGFHSIGLAGTIACGCFINSLKTELVAVLDSPIFPSLSVIYDGKPHFPARIYANEEKKLAFFVSEVILDSYAHRHLAQTILDWVDSHKCKTIISIAGRAIKQENQTKKESTLHVISNSPIITKLLNDVGVLTLKNGTIEGIPGLLLNETNWKNIDVVVFVVDVIAGIPDFRAAANVAQVVSKIVPEAFCEIQPLIREAENIESNLKTIRSQTLDRSKEKIYG